MWLNGLEFKMKCEPTRYGNGIDFSVTWLKDVTDFPCSFYLINHD